MKKIIYISIIILLMITKLQAQYYNLSDVMRMTPAMPANMVSATQDEINKFEQQKDSVINSIEEMKKNYKHPYICNDEAFYKKMNAYYNNMDKINDYISNGLNNRRLKFAEEVLSLNTECWNKQQPILGKIEQLREKSSNPAQFQKEVNLEKELNGQLYSLKVDYAKQQIELYKSYIKLIDSDLAKLQPIIEAVDKTAIPKLKLPLTRSMALEVGGYYIEIASGTFDYNVGLPLE